MRPARLSLTVLSLGLALGVSAVPETKTRTESQAGTEAAAEVKPPAPADAAWLARAQQGLAEREYRASESGAGLQAPNRAHGLRTYFEPAGIRVHDRTAGGSPELLRLALARVGRGEQLAAMAAGAAVVADESRVEIRRPGLVEWFVNSPAGLEQGFTLAERPAGEGALVLELTVAGATPRLRGDAIVFATPAASDSARLGLAARPSGSRTLRYGALAAADATGRALAARFELPAPERLRIVVDDAGASYPLVIDPLLTETADTQLASDQPDARLGFSVAGAGDVNGDGWADVIVGAPYYDAGEADEGAAFVFLGSATGIADATPASAAAQLESDQPDAWLGTSVAGAGDVNGDGYADVIVSAPRYDAGEADEGAAFVFHGSATGLADGTPASAAAQLESDQAGAWLGIGVAGAGDVNGDGYADVIVGAWSYADPDPGEGAAFVFHGSASGVADGTPASAAATLESDQAGAQLGVRVAGAGDVNGDGYGDVIVGAWAYAAPELGEGAAFVFQGSATGLADGTPASAAAQLESDQAGAQLGASVAGAGDVNGDGYSDVIVGAPAYDAGQGAGEGAAFVFHGSATGLADGSPASAAAQLESDQAGARLGFSVAGAGDVNGDGYADVVVGALFYGAGEANEGAAFVFQGSSAGIADGNPTTALAQLEWDQADAGLGISVAGAGDVNGDGYADVIAGAAFADAGETDEGTAFVYLGGASGIPDGTPATAATQLESNQGNALLRSVAAAGDVNADGYGDVIVGVPNYDAGDTNEGAAFVFLGSASGIADGTPATAAAQFESNQYYALLGTGVAAAGDVNGDGYADVIVGAPGYTGQYYGGGAAFVFLGSASGVADGTPATAATQLESDQSYDAIGNFPVFGEAVAGAVDVNGDGHVDVIVGARGYKAGQTLEGAAFVFLGSATGLADGNPATAAMQLESNQSCFECEFPSRFGSAVAGADVNGDGYADVIVGAPDYGSNVGAPPGSAFVFHGSATGIADGNPATADAHPWSCCGAAGRAGDVNGDGYADVIVGPHVLLGSASGIADGFPTTPALQGVGTVVGAGDVNGDGYADVIAGSLTYGNGQAAFVFLGSAGGITSTAAAQLEPNQAGARFVNVAGAGDVNGDGYADVIVGASGYDHGQTDEGAAFVFHGNGNGRPVVAQQLRSAVATPIQPWGSTDSPTSFRVRLQATHPEGRGRVKLAVEYCPPGVAFGHASCGSEVGASWTDVGATSGGVTLTETVDGLAGNTPYRWRARVLHAPFRVTEPGIAAPPSPAHGPWRRVAAQAEAVDLRTVPAPVCSDGFDNDGDGLFDYPSDPGCTSSVDDSERETGLSCDDGLDDDGDGFSDYPSDPGCTSSVDASEREAGHACDDGLDNDGDLLLDFPSDPGCTAAIDPSEEPGSACYDGLDNDQDGEIDFDPACNALVNPVGDCGCSSETDTSERDQTGSYPCDDGADNDFDDRIDFDPVTRADAPDFSAGVGDPGCESPTWLREDPQCQDGVSNDPSQDPQGLKDFDGGQSLFGPCSGGSCPSGVSDVGDDGVADPDPQCAGQPWKNREKIKTGCGLGFELVLLLPALAGLRRRGRTGATC